MNGVGAPREIGLDALRGVAVLLVIGTHLPAASPISDGAFLHLVTDSLRRGGWIGVDVFFVLSGFLIASLLFSEHARVGRIYAARFLVRRAFKIYPAYYALLLVTVPAVLTGKYLIEPKLLLMSALFVGSYVGNAWAHLWSLAVEEHFYILVAGLLALTSRRSRRNGPPFDWVPFLVGFVGVACLLGRLLSVPWYADEWWKVRELTHLRLDALAYGVGLAWLRQYRSESWTWWTRRSAALALIGAAVLLPPFVFSLEGTRFYAAAFTLYSLGSMTLVIHYAGGRPRFPWLTRPLAALGKYSYSVYLVHFPVVGVTKRLFAVEVEWAAFAVFYLVASVTVGIALAATIEMPFLAVRDRFFPRIAP